MQYEAVTPEYIHYYMLNGANNYTPTDVENIIDNKGFPRLLSVVLIRLWLIPGTTVLFLLNYPLKNLTHLRICLLGNQLQAYFLHVCSLCRLLSLKTSLC